MTILPRSRALAILSLTPCLFALGSPAFARPGSDPSPESGYFFRPGYTVDVYQGPWSADMDLDKRKPVTSRTILEFPAKEDTPRFPEAPQDGFTVIKGYLELPKSEEAWFSPGYGQSKASVMTVDGKQVYRQLPGQTEQQAARETIQLAAGMHPFRIVHFTPVDRLLCFSNLGRRLGAEYVRTKVRFEPEMETKLVKTLTALTNDAAGRNKLSDERMAECNAIIDENRYIFGETESIMRAAFDFVTTHDAHADYLFKVNRQEWGKGSKRTGLRWADFQVMQYLLDYAYTPENLAKFPDLLGRAQFATAEYFPGPCDPPADPDARYAVKIWASFPDTAAQQTFMFHNSARKPTGAYLAPGTVATVTVPQSLVNKGFRIRVGAHANDLQRKPQRHPALPRLAALPDPQHASPGGQPARRRNLPGGPPRRRRRPSRGDLAKHRAGTVLCQHPHPCDEPRAMGQGRAPPSRAMGGFPVRHLHDAAPAHLGV